MCLCVYDLPPPPVQFDVRRVCRGQQRVRLRRRHIEELTH